MDVFEAVDSRIACRAFLDRPVDLKIVKDIIVQGAARGVGRQPAKPGTSTRCTGTPLAEFKAIVAEAHRRRRPAPHAKSEYPIYPDPMFGAYKERRDAHGLTAHGLLGIARRPTGRGGSINSRRTSSSSTRRSPLFITIDRRLAAGQWADLGGYINSLAVLARGYGLDTCPQEAWARLYDTIGEFLNIPPHLKTPLLACGDRLRRQEAQGQRLPLAARRTARVLQIPRFRLTATNAIGRQKFHPMPALSSNLIRQRNAPQARCHHTKNKIVDWP